MAAVPAPARNHRPPRHHPVPPPASVSSASASPASAPPASVSPATASSPAPAARCAAERVASPTTPAPTALTPSQLRPACNLPPRRRRQSRRLPLRPGKAVSAVCGLVFSAPADVFRGATTRFTPVVALTRKHKRGPCGESPSLALAGLQFDERFHREETRASPWSRYRRPRQWHGWHLRIRTHRRARHRLEQQRLGTTLFLPAAATLALSHGRQNHLPILGGL